MTSEKLILNVEKAIRGNQTFFNKVRRGYYVDFYRMDDNSCKKSRLERRLCRM